MIGLPRGVAAFAVLFVSACGAAAAEQAADDGGLGRYLASFALDREAREILDRPGPWDADRLGLAVRVLARLALAPPEYAADWTAAASDGVGEGIPAEDRLVRFVGHAVRVDAVPLPPEMSLPAAGAEAAPRDSVDLVRVRSGDGRTLDVLTPAAPRAWARGEPIAEAVTVSGLPLAPGSGPWPGGDPEGERAEMLLGAPRVAWHAPGLAGELGMDAGLFDGVVDGRRLQAGDADAFYALLAVAGRAEAGAIAAAAGPPRSIIPLLDRSVGWFAEHRGEPVSIEGIALKATRIEIDDPVRRRQTGLDHYWEVFIFVTTPPIEVGGEVLERYPVVCCLRRLPPGMPSGASISEPVRVAGFAFKSYAYPLPPRDGVDRRREAPLLVGGDVASVRGTPPPAAALPGWGLVAVVALLAAVVVAAVLATGRRGVRRRPLPDRVGPPTESPAPD